MNVQHHKLLRCGVLCVWIALCGLAVPADSFAGVHAPLDAAGLVRAQETDARLTHGPVIGGVTSQGAVIFVRTDSPATVAIRYATSPDMTGAQTSETRATAEDADMTALVPLNGLAAGTEYFIDALVNDVVAADSAARFKTFPTEDSQAALQFAITTDFGAYGEGDQPPLNTPTNTFRQIDAANPDFVFIGGDFDHRNPHTLDEKRQMFKDLYSPDNPRAPMPEFVPLILRRYPVAHQWDDHDFYDNDADRTAPGRSFAAQAFREFFPTYPLPNNGALYQSFRYGQNDFFILDNRYFRDPNHETPSRSKSMLDGEDLKKAGQLAWLKHRLKQSNARWKIIFSSSVFNLSTRKSDSWVPFTREHDAIVNFVRTNNIKNVIVISGDIHAGALDNGTNAGLPNVVAPGPNLKYCFTVPQDWPGTWSNGIYGSSKNVDNAIPCNGFGLVKLTERAAKIRILDTEGKTKLKMNIKWQP